MKKNLNNEGKTHAILYAICVFLFGVGHTKIQNLSTVTNVMVKYGKFIPVFFSMLLLLPKQKIKKKSLLIILVFMMVLLFCFFAKDLSYTSFFILYFIFACRKTDVMYIYKYYYWSISLVLFFTITLSMMNVIPNNIDRYGRYDLGFTFATFGSNLFLSVCLAFACLKKEKIRLIEWVFILLLNVYLFLKTDTEAVFLCVGFLFFVWVLLKNKGVYNWILKSKHINCVLSHSAAICCTLTIVLQLLYNHNYNKPIMISINKILSTRPIMGRNVFLNYSDKFLPLIRELIFGMNRDAVSYLDSSYLSILTAYGIITLLLFCYFMDNISKRCLKTKDLFIPVCVLVFMVHCITDPQLISFRCNPLIITSLFYDNFKSYRNSSNFNSTLNLRGKFCKCFF